MTKILSNKSNIDLDYPICRPSLDLDFTQERLDPRITFSRGSIGTRVNRNRLIETVAANQPRFDYDPVTGECKGLLIEESRVNLLTYSEDFNQGIWTKVGVTISANSTTSPTGELTADTLVENTSTGTHRCVIAPTIANTTVYTVSVYAKQAGRTNFRLSLGSGLTGEVIVNLSNGIVASSTGATNIIIQNVGNGWYRISFTAAASTGTTGQVQVQLVQGTITTSYSGDGTSGIYVWGAQLEAGAFPTSYIPTTASTVTRSVDNASMTGRNFSSWYNQTEGTLYASINNITTRSSTTYDAFVSLAGTDVNRNVMRIYTQTGPGGGAQNKFLGAVAYSPDGSYAFPSFDGSVGGPDRIGKTILSYKKDNFAFTVNGLTPTRDVSGDIPTCNQLLIFGASRFQLAPSGYISRLTYYPRALKPNQLQFLTQ